MKLIRFVVGIILKVLDKLTSPSPLKISEEQKVLITNKSKGLELFEFSACPFCIKVKRYMRQHNIKVPLRDAKNDESYRKELLDNGGKIKVPCLKIEKDGKVQWMYESNDIITYLEKQVLSN